MPNLSVLTGTSAVRMAGLLFALGLLFSVAEQKTVLAVGEVEFPGAILKVDRAAGKVTVKKAGSGTRFTFVVNAKTKFEGTKDLAGLMPGDAVTVLYVTEGGTYLAKAVIKSAK